MSNTIDLGGRNAVVTGGAQGIGREFTQVVVVFHKHDAQAGNHSSKQIFPVSGW